MKKPFETGCNIAAPSILAGNHANLAAGVRTVADAGAKWLHIDIMDGHFVPNLTFGPQTVADLRKESDLFFDVHLMLECPDKYFKRFVDAGADSVSIHIEPEYDVPGTLRAIRDLGCYCGIVLNPDTPHTRVVPLLEEVDLVLQMTVFPGYGGQSFIQNTMKNVEALRAYRDQKGLNYRIEVDGGVDLDTISVIKAAGADTFVSGSAFFRSIDKAAFVTELTR